MAILDDYQRVAPALGPWEDLGDDAAVTAFDDHVDDDALVERLPNLRLLVTTGRANASIDMDAARELGIIVAGTDSLTSPTAELTWALILAVCRNVCAEDRAIREGAWQHTIGPELAGGTLGVAGLGRLGSRAARAVRVVDRLEAAGLPHPRVGSIGRAPRAGVARAGRSHLAEAALDARARVLLSAVAQLDADDMRDLERLLGALLDATTVGLSAAAETCRLCDPHACAHYEGACPVSRAADRYRAPV